MSGAVGELEKMEAQTNKQRLNFLVTVYYYYVSPTDITVACV